MKLQTKILLLALAAILFFALRAASLTHRVAEPQPRTAQPQSDNTERQCTPVGGMLMTNFGAISQTTTMGTATGDLAGAVAGTLLGAPEPGAGNTVIFHVQHHWVTQTGDTLYFDHATATTVPIAPGLFAILSYPIHLVGGTGKFAGATGDLTGTIGEVNLPNLPDVTGGTSVFRYSGKVCYAE